MQLHDSYMGDDAHKLYLSNFLGQLRMVCLDGLSTAIICCFYDLGWRFPRLVNFNNLSEPYKFHLLPKMGESPTLSTCECFSSKETATMLDENVHRKVSTAACYVFCF